MTNPWSPLPGRPLLVRHLGKLQQGFTDLRGQTRDAFARTLATVIAGLVCEAVRGALSTTNQRSVLDSWPRPQRPVGRSLLDVFGERPPEESDDAPNPWDDPLPEVVTERECKQLALPGRAAELALGLRVAAWWLSRPSRRTSLWTALGFGALAGTSALLAGPVVRAGLSLAESLLSLATLDTAAHSARTLAGPAD
jgi:hypothetical protein